MLLNYLLLKFKLWGGYTPIDKAIGDYMYQQMPYSNNDEIEKKLGVMFFRSNRKIYNAIKNKKVDKNFIMYPPRKGKGKERIYYCSCCFEKGDHDYYSVIMVIGYKTQDSNYYIGIRRCKTKEEKKALNKFLKVLCKDQKKLIKRGTKELKFKPRFLKETEAEREHYEEIIENIQIESEKIRKERKEQKQKEEREAHIKWLQEVTKRNKREGRPRYCGTDGGHECYDCPYCKSWHYYGGVVCAFNQWKRGRK